MSPDTTIAILAVLGAILGIIALYLIAKYRKLDREYSAAVSERADLRRMYSAAVSERADLRRRIEEHSAFVSRMAEREDEHREQIRKLGAATIDGFGAITRAAGAEVKKRVREAQEQAIQATIAFFVEDPNRLTQIRDEEFRAAASAPGPKDFAAAFAGDFAPFGRFSPFGRAGARPGFAGPRSPLDTLLDDLLGARGARVTVVDMDRLGRDLGLDGGGEDGETVVTGSEPTSEPASASGDPEVRQAPPAGETHDGARDVEDAASGTQYGRLHR
jgi:hypothetical protein